MLRLLTPCYDGLRPLQAADCLDGAGPADLAVDGAAQWEIAMG